MGDLSPYTSIGQNNLNKLFISPNQSELFDEEEQIESEIKTLLKRYRDAKKFFTRFNDNLACVLSTALQCYEMNKLTGSSINSETFQSGIRNMIPDGHVFKAFPIQLPHKNSVAAFETIRSNPVGEEIVNVIGDQINYSVRVRIVPFPEGIFATWIMLGVHYIEI